MMQKSRYFLSVILILTGFSLNSLAQDKLKTEANWFNLDLIEDGVPGISTEKAYRLLLKDKVGTDVIVAVIDGGVDIEHEDLKNVIWVNDKEVAGDSLDNDENGYVDDINGWNFIGGPDQGNVQYDNLEVLRLVRELYPRYRSVLPSTPLVEDERRAFQSYLKMNTDYMAQLERAQMSQRYIALVKTNTENIVSAIGKEEPTLSDFNQFKPRSKLEGRVLKVIKKGVKEEGSYKRFKRDLDEAVDAFNARVNYHLNMNYDPRSIVDDYYENGLERYYGNSDVTGPDASHGTHVAGIIAADRVNGKGIKGVSDHAKIMAIRTVPDGDERDKDVANAILYAVDNGAKVINMSFGKPYAKNKHLVDSAVRYAVQNDVLLIHAAGNEGQDNDEVANYPNRTYVDSLGMNLGVAEPWIEVGATHWKYGANLLADFSNYGKRSVDVFAPGVAIYSTYPSNKYKEEQGTSMAAPVVAGLASLIRAYYPDLTAVQVKEAIVNSVVKPDHKVKVSSGKGKKRVYLSDISISGGIVNAFNALQLAEKMSSERSN